MTINSAELLKKLEPAVRPGAGLASASAPRGIIEAQSFDQLLALASAGQIASGRQIEVAFDPSPPLDAGQLERLAAAADQAEAAGSKHALMMFDGRAFVLDVDKRTLTAEFSRRGDLQVQRVDAVIMVDARDGESGTPLAPPALGLIPPAILRQITAQGT